ncbi:MAG: hypothetical protein HY737_07165 [Candidatus Omnitrophica bacterium]|nr:hypothetical protein [Candidatus Omnitrophota bacterium]
MRHRHGNGGNRGFTLLETLLAGSLLLSVTLMGFLWLTNAIDLWSTTSLQSAARSDAQLAMSRMVNELRQGTRTAAGIPPNADIIAADHVRFSLPADNDGNGKIVDAIGAIEWGIVPVEYQWDAASQQLRRAQGAQTQVLASGVSSVAFAAVNTSELQLTLTLQRRTSRGRQLSASATEIVKLRN